MCVLPSSSLQSSGGHRHTFIQKRERLLACCAVDGRDVMEELGLGHPAVQPWGASFTSWSLRMGLSEWNHGRVMRVDVAGIKRFFQRKVRCPRKAVCTEDE